MKAEAFYLIDKERRNNCLKRINELELDGKIKVTLSNAGDKSSRQRGLQWIWNTDVSLSGIGGEHEDTKNGVHIISKWRWCRPILLRDDELFRVIYNHFMADYSNDKEKVMRFARDWIHTEKLNSSQMADYLKDFQNYYLSKGVNLTDPDDKKLLESRGE